MQYRLKPAQPQNQAKLRFTQNNKWIPLLSVAVHPLQISKTWRHPNTEQRVSVSSADKLNQHFLYFLAVGSLSNTAALFLSSCFGDCFILKICFQHSASLFNDTLLYCKPAYHHSCWFTQRCQMYQVEEKSFQSFAVTKEQQLASQSLSQVADLRVLAVC
jgi:hypothetical protein